ncbi:MAG: hypothetical protein JF586_21180 [Burkholderiales bacterium]|nr:hypothetical protein [Burkholderiales bacterium]
MLQFPSILPRGRSNESLHESREETAGAGRSPFDEARHGVNVDTGRDSACRKEMGTWIAKSDLEPGPTLTSSNDFKKE